MADEADQGEKKPTDPLKAFCLVLGVLTLVLFGLWIKLRGDRDDYAEANVRAEQYLTGKGIAPKTPSGIPNPIPDLAFEVERYVETHKTTSGGAADGESISLALMEQRATGVNMKRVAVGNERTDKGKGYITKSRTFDYETTTLRNLLNLVWNIETVGRYKVSEVAWQLAEKKDNTAPPFNLVTKPRIKVSVRIPTRDEKEK